MEKLAFGSLGNSVALTQYPRAARSETARIPFRMSGPPWPYETLR